ncbi:hypothetical protein RZO31_04930 [Lactococcus lactis]|uniref:Uncharacterized protein n=1 Tax=Lactococcus lactis TaxID=1358 RepID=A0AAE4NRC6_9LACT|nr:hypothetical protein [Lactococcus lactis]MDV2632221.1 hypothetical protein [Lactococcus lactis]
MDARRFKQWLLDVKLDEDDLFEESLKCYTVEAYKASYIFSYLGFINYIRIITLAQTTPPANFTNKWLEKIGEKEEEERKKVINKKWNRLLEELDSQDDWEKSTMNLIQEVEKSNIFSLRNDISKEFEQKRILRNVSAHNKERKISFNTVEDLWDFISYAYPYFVVGGSLEIWKEKFYKIIKFSEKFEQELKIDELVSFYNKLREPDKKELFAWVINQVSEEIFNLNYEECFDIFLRKINLGPNSPELGWINNKRSLLYTCIVIDNFECLVDKEELQSYIYDNANLTQVLGILIEYGSCKRICEILSFIYSEKHFLTWWDILRKVASSLYEFEIDKSIESILISSGKISSLFSGVSQSLYTYKTGYSEKIHKTDTFDYRQFDRYKGDIKILLILIKNLDLQEEYAKDLLYRIDRIIKKDYSDLDNLNNYKLMYDFFERDSTLFSWLKKSVV